MEYVFDTVLDRHGTNAMKWDVAPGELPMSLADMDFATAPEIQAAIRRRADHGAFGYSVVPESWKSAVCGWWERRHGVRFEPEWLIYCTGVVPAISTAVRKLTTPAEDVLIQTPVYNIFYNSILNNGRRVLESPLRYARGAYAVDWADLEEKLARPQTTMMILCNPHNPVGKLWDRETLARLGEMCKRHHVVVLSDEIHCDLADPGKEYVPFLSASDACREVGIACVAPTKAFNLAGLQTACVVVAEEGLRARMDRALNTDEVAEPNAFAIQAAEAAFNQGGPWLDAARQYIFENKQLVRETLTRELPSVRVVPSEATYLLWLDCTALPGDSQRLCAFLRRETGLILSAGSQYGAAGAHFLRMNTAYPRAQVEDGLARLIRGVRAYAAKEQGE